MPGEDPKNFAQRLAHEKASAGRSGPGEVVLGADTIVVLDEEVFGKPGSEAAAKAMLQRLAGRDHWVYTGICLVSAAQVLSALEATRVTFCEMSEAEIDAYVESGEPMDKAGGYAIQGLASKFISSIEGSYSNVVGLPVSLVYRYWNTLSRDHTTA
jgi:septum formation protein